MRPETHAQALMRLLLIRLHLDLRIELDGRGMPPVFNAAMIPVPPPLGTGLS